MNIIETIKDGLRIARTSKTLWLYGFFVGLGASLESGNKGHAPGVPAAAHIAPHALTGGIAVLLGIAAVALIAAGVFMYFVSEGALITGVTRVHRGKLPTVTEGWRDGLAHWSVLFRITVIYFALSVGSLIVLAAPFILAMKLAGTALGVMLAIPAVLIAVPWLATLYMWKAFAARIAVLENRRAWDATGKARLFLHGRLFDGLKLIIAATVGRGIVFVLGLIALAAIGLVAFGVLRIFGMVHPTVPVMILGVMAVLPPLLILIAISGTTQSCIWTLGYLKQQEQ